MLTFFYLATLRACVCFLAIAIWLWTHGRQLRDKKWISCLRIANFPFSMLCCAMFCSQDLEDTAFDKCFEVIDQTAESVRGGRTHLFAFMLMRGTD